MNDMSHVFGDPREVSGPISREQLVHSLPEKREPSFEARPVHVRLFDELEMGPQGIAAKSSPAEENRMPERVEAREVSVPIHPGYIVENRPDQGIFPDLFVEAIHQFFDIRPVLDPGLRDFSVRHIKGPE